jgi:hypothetical protein
LLGKLTKMVVEGALEGEMDDHLGYAKHDPAGRDGGNSRKGSGLLWATFRASPESRLSKARICRGSPRAHQDLIVDLSL